MKIIITLLVILSPIFQHVKAQTYFQQDVSYVIKVSLDDKKHLLHASESITYTNNSPDELTTLYMHLWPNAYSSTSSAFARQKYASGSTKFLFADEKKRGGIDSLNFSVDGKEVTWDYMPGNPDIAQLQLNEPLKPGQSILVETPFRVKIPASFSRLGHIKNQYQMTQWYPKPAVYDREGWHPMPYLDQGEFYSEFGTFDVYIDIPRNYVVGSTGDLPEDDPEWEWLAEREKRSREWLDAPKDKVEFPREFAPEDRKVLHFHQEKVHDFAWFCDQDYYVLRDTVQLPYSGEEVSCIAMFNHKDRGYWEKAPGFISKAVYYYSLWNGDYPYRHATAIDGALSAGAGMEYPNITVLGAGGSFAALERVILHEVGHNWYYGILGSNERSYPWMDEGINTYFESRYWYEQHEGKNNMLPEGLQKQLGLEIDNDRSAQIAYKLAAGLNIDQPIQLSSEEYLPINYGVIVYMKSGLAFRFLEDYLGRETIDSCFHRYFDSWKFKHPQPADIQQVFEEVSGKDLSWFFEEYIRGNEKIDLRIRKINDTEILVQNRSKVKVPAPLTLTDKDGQLVRTLWTEPFTGETRIFLEGESFHQALVNPQGRLPELREDNNHLKAKGLFARCKPLKFHVGYKYPDPRYTNINYLPVLGYNTTDGLQLGMLFYSGLFPTSKFRFHLMPFYGVGSGRLTGSAGFTLRWLPQKIFRKIEFRHRTAMFSTLFRSKNTVFASLTPKDANSAFRQNFSFDLHTIGNRQDSWNILPSDFWQPAFGQLHYRLKANRPLYKLNVHAETGGNAASNSYRGSLDASYSRFFLKRKMRLSVRAFAGGFLGDPAPFPFEYRLSGSDDPFGENVVFDRAGTNNWFSRQIQDDHGGFRSLVPQRFDQSIWALNGSAKLPYVPLEFFANVGGGSNQFVSTGDVIYDAGFSINLLFQSIRINFPVAGSVFPNGWAEGIQEFGQNINFSFQPARLLRIMGMAGFSVE